MKILKNKRIFLVVLLQDMIVVGNEQKYVMNYLNMVILKLLEHIVKIPNQLVIHIMIKSIIYLEQSLIYVLRIRLMKDILLKKYFKLLKVGLFPYIGQ